MKVRQGLVVAALGIGLMGCGVQPTGVVDAGEPASGLTSGIRLYFASTNGLRGVSLIDTEIKDLASVMKLLAQGPSPTEQRDGLASVYEIEGYTVTGEGTRVTLDLSGQYTGSGQDQGTGQLVCTLARAQSVLEPKVMFDDVEVTLDPEEGIELGPYRCADFLNE
ncbi:GerMN domain-containing protein [Streptomyces sp. NPDC005953]|uniref:GerMN domain-containing protein n=1 Tax=unclassified Streptomyces TaxID=2593676 RepID=UPI0033CB81EA